MESQGVLQQERRKAIRVPSSLPVTLLDPSKSLLDLDSRLVDISRSGLGLVTTAPLVLGEAVLFRLDIPGEGLIAGQAVTRWCRQDDMERSRYFSGVEIQSLAQGHAGKIRRYVGLSGGQSLEWVDGTLMAACVAIGFLIIQSSASFSAGAALSRQFTIDLFSWLPQAGVILASIAGIFLLLRYR